LPSCVKNAKSFTFKAGEPLCLAKVLKITDKVNNFFNTFEKKATEVDAFKLQ